jgi:microcompartment protein CcmL/EutN
VRSRPIETSSIAQGIVAADAMVKRAEVDLLQASVLSPGATGS